MAVKPDDLGEGIVGDLGDLLDSDNPMCYRAAFQVALLEACDDAVALALLNESDCIGALLGACITRAAYAGASADEFAAALQERADRVPAIFEAIKGAKH